MKKKKNNTILLTGINAICLDILCSALEEKHFDVIQSSNLLDIFLENICPDILKDLIIIAGEEGLDISGREAVIKLREKYFITNPVILLSNHTQSSDDQNHWATQYLAFPPKPIAFFKAIDNSKFLSEERYRQLIRAGLYNLGATLRKIYDMLIAESNFSDQGFIDLSQDVLELCTNDSSVSKLPSIQELINEIKTIQSLARIKGENLDNFVNVVSKVELEARENNASDIFKSKIHTLKNKTALAMGPKLENSGLIENAELLLAKLPITNIDAIAPDAKIILTNLRDNILPSLKQFARDPQGGKNDLIKAFENTKEYIDKLKAIFVDRAPVYATNSTPIKSIIMVEDEELWREQIANIIKESGYNGDIQHATTVEEAEKLLSGASSGTLVFMDMGLPRNEKDAIKGLLDLNAGLNLLKKYSKKGNLIFIMLTAASNYSEAVLETLSCGLSPYEYIQKNSSYWDNQLRSQLALIFEPKPKDTLVQVFAHTGSLISINGIGVELERKPFIVFKYLAEQPRMARPVFNMRHNLCDDLAPRDFITPIDWLTPERIQEYISEIRTKVRDAFTKAGRSSEIPEELISYEDERFPNGAYILKAKVKIHPSFDEFYSKRLPRKLLIIEDSQEWIDEITKILEQFQFEKRIAQTIEEVERVLDSWVPDIITLDICIPRNQNELNNKISNKETGLEAFDLILKKCPNAKVSVLTSIAWDDSMMLKFLKEGIDIISYIGKQWDNIAERLTRSIIKHSREQYLGLHHYEHDINNPTYYIQSIDNEEKKFVVNGYTIELTEMEWRVFKGLLITPFVQITRDTIKNLIWPDADECPDNYENSLNATIKRLRNKISNKSGSIIDGHKLICTKFDNYYLNAYAHE